MQLQSHSKQIAPAQFIGTKRAKGDAWASS
jgi:hypothetical protein